MSGGLTTPNAVLPRRYILRAGAATRLLCRHARSAHCACQGHRQQPAPPPPQSARACAPHPTQPRTAVHGKAPRPGPLHHPRLPRCRGCRRSAPRPTARLRAVRPAAGALGSLCLISTHTGTPSIPSPVAPASGASPPATATEAVYHARQGLPHPKRVRASPRFTSCAGSP